jgi:hypothetical protein
LDTHRRALEFGCKSWRPSAFAPTDGRNGARNRKWHANGRAQIATTSAWLNRVERRAEKELKWPRQSSSVTFQDERFVIRKNSAKVAISYGDARRSRVELDVLAFELDDLARKGRKTARRGRKPKAES